MAKDGDGAGHFWNELDKEERILASQCKYQGRKETSIGRTVTGFMLVGG